MKLNEIKDIKKDVAPMTAKEELKAVHKVIAAAEDELEKTPGLGRDARYKDVDVLDSKKEIEWITQESSTEQSKTAAKVIAKMLRKAGVKGWKVKVIIRDEVGGRDGKTAWQTAKS